MTNFFGVILVLLRPPTARPHAPKSFRLPLSPFKTPYFSLRFCVADGAKGAQKGALQRRSGASCEGFVEDLWRICGFALATGRIPFGGTLGVSLGLVRTTIVTIRLRRNERTKRASNGMHGARGRGSQTDKAKRLQRIAGAVNEGSQRKRTGNPSLRARWLRTRSNTFNAASRRYFGVAIRRHFPPKGNQPLPVVGDNGTVHSRHNLPTGVARR